jgi:hypothetical protein
MRPSPSFTSRLSAPPLVLPCGGLRWDAPPCDVPWDVPPWDGLPCDVLPPQSVLHDPWEGVAPLLHRAGSTAPVLLHKVLHEPLPALARK